MDAERTPDGHHLVIGGRKWRAADPSIPPKLEAELVAVLMEARRTVGTAGRAGDDDAVAAARGRVHAAKVALGERGRAWWEPPTDEADRLRVGAAIATLLRHRGPDKTICPSDAARVAGGPRWRDLVPLARVVARDLAIEGILDITQKGEPIDPRSDWRGPVRLRSR